MACSITGSWIDYCNALLINATGKTLNHLECIHNNLARVVFDVGIRKLHTSGYRSLDLLRELYWLLVQARPLLCFKSYKLGRQPTCHCYWNSIRWHAFCAHRRKTCWLFHDQGPKLQHATSLQLHLMFRTAFRLQSELCPVSVHSDHTSRHTCIISASNDHVIYLCFCSSGNSST